MATDPATGACGKARSASLSPPQHRRVVPLLCHCCVLDLGFFLAGCCVARTLPQCQRLGVTRPQLRPSGSGSRVAGTVHHTLTTSMVSPSLVLCHCHHHRDFSLASTTHIPQAIELAGYGNFDIISPLSHSFPLFPTHFSLISHSFLKLWTTPHAPCSMPFVSGADSRACNPMVCNPTHGGQDPPFCRWWGSGRH